MATSNFSHQDMVNMAHTMRRLGPNKNPVINPQAMANVPARSQPLVKAVMSSPYHAAIASGAHPGTSLPAGSGIDTGDPGSGTAGTSTANSNLGYGPAHMRRTPNTRHQVLGFTSTSCGTGAPTQVTAVPYRPFRASRAVIGAYFIGATAVAAGGSTVGLWQVGAAPQFAAVTSEPVGIFASGLNGGYCDFDEAAPAIGIGCTVTAQTTATFYGALIGSTRRQKDNNRPTETKVQRLPIPQVSVAAAGTLTTAQGTVTPIMQFWGRQIIADGLINDHVGLTSAASTGSAAFNLASLYVGADPQFMNLPSSTAPVPWCTFSNLFDLFLDLDMADTAVPYAFSATNIGTVSAVFGGVVLGDVDKRRLSSYGETGSPYAQLSNLAG